MHRSFAQQAEQTHSSPPNGRAIKRWQQEAWAEGNYAMVAASLVPMSERLCEVVDLRAGQRVLDVATGSGNTALAAAGYGCEVIGIDITPALLEQGRQLAEAERLAVTFQEGDAEALPFADASFDVVLSSTGVMFAPNQQQAAREVLRVCRSGGKIGLANWT
jgi:ubiquinone/menaquinone biosynthesis C-methylase UbiE